MDCIGLPSLNYENYSINSEFKFYGKLESFIDDNTLWLRGETLSLSINLKGNYIYRLGKSNKELEKVLWSNMSSIMEGTNFFVVGKLVYHNGTAYMVDSEKNPLTVVLYEDNSNLIHDLIVKGRDRNELWNSYTPYSYICGIFILIILSFFEYRSNSDKIISYYLLVAAGTPFYFFIPPGLIFYLIYRNLWEVSIRYSTLRDLARIRNKELSMKKYRRESKNRERLSLFFYLIGYVINIYIAGIIIFKMYQLLILR